MTYIFNTKKKKKVQMSLLFITTPKLFKFLKIPQRVTDMEIPPRLTVREWRLLSRTGPTGLVASPPPPAATITSVTPSPPAFLQVSQEIKTKNKPAQTSRNCCKMTKW